MAKHLPVLLQETIDGLNLEGGEIFLDGTLGGGGHSAEVARRFGETVRIIGLDRDRGAVESAEKGLSILNARFDLRVESFGNLDDVLEKLGIENIQGILFDLGISSDQLEDSGRGFSFLKDEPLLMTMSEEPQDLNATVILNTWDEETLELILRGFGEEKYSRKIARAIVQRREKKPFERTFDLVEIVRDAVPAFYEKGRIHPATRTFQALRIATNEELATLETGLIKGFKALSNNGRFAVISFHSLEDRMVKNFFRGRALSGEGRLVNKKPITPSEGELGGNQRSRSAKLRILEKL